jgi:hypothetical protein
MRNLDVTNREVAVALFPDGDVVAFLWTTAVVVFASHSQIKKNTRPIPAKYDLEEVPESSLTQAQKDYLEPIDSRLATLNYRPELTFRAANYGQNLMRRYSNPVDPASCELTVVEVKSRVGSVETVRNSNLVSFTSRLADGRRLSTRNMPHKSVMDRLPHQIMQEYPNLTDLALLKRKHDARAAQLGAVIAPPHGREAVFSEMQREHERFTSHQVTQGVLRPVRNGSAYEITGKVATRGILNFFNPFAKRFSIPLVLFNALVGALLPLFGILKIVPALSASTHGLSVGWLSAPTLAIASCYALAGALMALSGGPDSYVWMMLVTYLPAHFVAGWSFGLLPYSCIAHLVAHVVGQAKQRRGLVLQT